MPSFEKQRIKLLPIDDNPVDLKCPNCGQAIYHVFKNRQEVIRGGYWLRDGDTIPGIVKVLLEEQKTPNGFDYALLVGSQACCNQDYYVVESQFIDAEFEKDFPASFFEYHIYNMQEKNFVACYQTSDTRIPAQWILTEVSSPRGIIHRHLFGPFELLEDIEGPHGVSACGIFAELSPWTHGREMLLALWDDMKELLREANQKNKEKALATLRRCLSKKLPI